MKAQSSVEFAMITSFMILIMTVFLGLSTQRLASIQDQNNYALLEDLANYIKTEIELGNSAYDGYSRTFDLPLRLSGHSYEITINPYTGTDLNHSEILVEYSDFDQEFSVLLPQNLTGEIDVEESLKVNLTKRGNKLFINP